MAKAAKQKPKRTSGDGEGKLKQADTASAAFPYLERASGTSNERAQFNLLNQVLRLVKLSADQDEQRAQVESIVVLLQGIAPKGELEGMLAVQMVATHTIAMDCLVRASLEGQTFEGRQVSLTHAEKLLALYARQVEVLDKHRGKGQQQVTVKYVNVESGGKAVVGNVRSEGAQNVPEKRKKAQPTIAYQSEDFEPMEILPVREKKPVRRR